MSHAQFENQQDLLAAKPRREVLNGFLQEPSVAVLWGTEGSRKTLISLAMSNAICYGADFNRKPAAQGMAVYLAWEGYRRLTGERRSAWLRYYRHTIPSVDSFKAVHFNDLMPGEREEFRRLNLLSVRGREQLAGMIEEEAVTHGHPRIVILDTGASLISTHRLRESQRTFTDLAITLRWLANRLNCCVLIILHARAKGDAIRGPVTYLTGEADTVMKCEKVGDQTYLTITKQRAGRDDLTYCFDCVEVDLETHDETGAVITQPVVVLRGSTDADATKGKTATSPRDSEWLMRLAREMQNGERTSPNEITQRAWGSAGGEQFKRLRRLVPFEGVTIHVPDQNTMKRLYLHIEDEREWICCEEKPVIVPEPWDGPCVPTDVEPASEPPADHLDDDDEPVQSGHMTKREARWFLWFQQTFSASMPDQARYAGAIGSVRFPVFTQDREEGIRCLHLMVANATTELVRERARLALEKFGVDVPPAPTTAAVDKTKTAEEEQTTGIAPTADVAPTAEILAAAEIAQATDAEPTTDVAPTVDVAPTAEIPAAAEMARATDAGPTTGIAPTTKMAQATDAEPATGIAPTAEVSPTAEIPAAAEIARATDAGPTTRIAPTAEMAQATDAEPATGIAPTAEVAPTAEIPEAAEMARATEAAKTTEIAVSAAVAPIAEIPAAAETAQVTEAEPTTEVAAAVEIAAAANVAPAQPKRRGRPKGTKNKPGADIVAAADVAPAQRKRRGRPKGTKTKPGADAA